MELLVESVGPLATNCIIAADSRTHEAIAIDTAIPSLAFVSGELADRGWTLKLIVSTHGHWDHIGDNAAVAEHTGAPIAVHPADRARLEHPEPLFAPFEIPPSVPAVDLAEGGEIRFGDLRLRVLHTPGHTEGSVCLHAADDGILLSGDTLFAGGWGRVDLPGGSPVEMATSLARLAVLDDRTRVIPGHGSVTTIVRERAWLDEVARTAGCRGDPPAMQGPASPARMDGVTEEQLRRDAVERAYRDHAGDVYRVTYAILRDPEAASDATHEAFARAFVRWEQYDAARPLRPWLHRIAARVALDAVRRRKVRAIAALPLDDDGKPGASTRAAVAAGPDTDPATLVVRRELVEAGLDSLRPDARAAVVLRHYYGYDYAEIAAVLGTSSGNVGSILSRAHAALRLRLALVPVAEGAAAGPVRRAQ